MLSELSNIIIHSNHWGQKEIESARGAKFKAH